MTNAELIAEGEHLEKCDFTGDCDSCDIPEGCTWVRMSYSDVAEAEYYICGKCLIREAVRLGCDFGNKDGWCHSKGNKHGECKHSITMDDGSETTACELAL